LQIFLYFLPDERDKDLFLEECKKGEIEIHAVKCILSGLPRVGKTSFLFRLQGKKPPDECSSTGFERPVSISILEQTKINAAMIRRGTWVHTDNVLEEGYHFLQQVKQKKTLPEQATTQNSSVHSSKPIEKPSDQPVINTSLDAPVYVKKESVDLSIEPLETVSSAIVLDQPVINTSLDVPAHVEKESVAHSNEPREAVSSAKLSEALPREFISDILKNPSSVQKILEKLEESTTVYFMETGGQPEFHEYLTYREPQKCKNN